MANVREIIKRRDSVTSIYKITNTMEMVATSKYRKTHSRAVGTRPYTDRLADLVANLVQDSGCVVHPLLEKNPDASRTVVLVLTTNRGLCGGYNGALIDLAMQTIEAIKNPKQDNDADKDSEQKPKHDSEREVKRQADFEVTKEIELRVSGKKGIGYFRYVGCEPDICYTHFNDKTTFVDVEVVANELIEAYSSGELHEVYVVYTALGKGRRHSARVLKLLPFTELLRPSTKPRRKVEFEEYLFSPPSDEIMNELIPTAIRMILFNCFVDAIVTEQIARMTAMQAAASNADQMIDMLSKQYNRIRQSQITSQMLDIVGGTEALR